MNAYLERKWHLQFVITEWLLDFAAAVGSWIVSARENELVIQIVKDTIF